VQIPSVLLDFRHSERKRRTAISAAQNRSVIQAKFIPRRGARLLLSCGRLPGKQAGSGPSPSAHLLSMSYRTPRLNVHCAGPSNRLAPAGKEMPDDSRIGAPYPTNCGRPIGDGRPGAPDSMWMRRSKPGRATRDWPGRCSIGDNHAIHISDTTETRCGIATTRRPFSRHGVPSQSYEVVEVIANRSGCPGRYKRAGADGVAAHWMITDPAVEGGVIRKIAALHRTMGWSARS